MFSASAANCCALEYQEAGKLFLTAPYADLADQENGAGEAPPSGVPEEEVARRVAAASAEAIAATEARLGAQHERERERLHKQVAETLRAFVEERSGYFERVEGEVIHLALAIARKILAREAQLDPTLLAGLVRIALDGMQSGPSVRLRVAPAEVEHWQQHAVTAGGAARWEVLGDGALNPGDCVVETEMGKANFGFEAQLRDIEQSFAQLITHRPERL